MFIVQFLISQPGDSSSHTAAADIITLLRCSSRLQLQDGAGDCEDQNISPEMSQNKDISSSPPRVTIY